MSLELSIVIPTCSQLALLEECVKSIKMNTVSYEIIIVANSEDADFHNAVDKLKGNCVKIYHMSKMAGFIQACNYGASQTIGNHICILNDDTVVGLNWARVMLRELRGDVHQVGPSLKFLDKSFNSVSKCTNMPYIEGFCFIITRLIYSRLGRLFDEGLQWSYCEDADLSTSIMQIEGCTISKVDVNIHHHGTKTRRSCKKIDKKCAKFEKVNKEYLSKKWRRLK